MWVETFEGLPVGNSIIFYPQVASSRSPRRVQILSPILCVRFIALAKASPALVLALSLRKSALIMNEITSIKFQIICWCGNNDSEKAFLRDHPVVIVHNEKNYPPYNFNTEGKYHIAFTVAEEASKESKYGKD